MLYKFDFIYFIILASLFLVPYTICQNSNCNGITNPNNRYDCLKFSTSNVLCCYKSENSPSCEEKNFSELKNLKNTIDCGVVDNRVGEYEFSIYHPNLSGQKNIGFQTCGAKKPKKKKDCTNYSQLTNSCCYFSGDVTGCYSIGKKYSDEDKEKKITIKDIEGNELNIEYECLGNFLNTIINKVFGVFILLYLIF